MVAKVFWFSLPAPTFVTPCCDKIWQQKPLVFRAKISINFPKELPPVMALKNNARRPCRFYKALGCLYTGVSNRSAISLLFTRCLGAILCRTTLFKVFRHEEFETTASLSIHQKEEKFLKKFSHHAIVLGSLTQNFFRQKMSQLLSVNIS